MISPSIACADYLNLKRDIRSLDKAGVDYFHIDIMDGHFVPNLCLNFDLVKQIRTISHTPMDVHLMVANPEDYVDLMEDCKIEYACTHPEACNDVGIFIDILKSKGIKTGLALSPDIAVDSITNYLPLLDYVLVLFVNPGFAGQAFIPSVLKKVKQLDDIRKRQGLEFMIFSDGGIGFENVSSVIQMGTDVIIAGVFTVFNQPDGVYKSCIKLKRTINNENR